jgi:hypothetical protein
MHHNEFKCDTCGSEMSLVLYGAGNCPGCPGDMSCALEARCDRCNPPPPPKPRYVPPPEPPTDYW